MENQNPQNRRITRHFIRNAAGTKRTAVQKMKANDMVHSFLRMQKTGPKCFCLVKWCPHTDSNRGPTDYKSVALPAEL